MNLQELLEEILSEGVVEGVGTVLAAGFLLAFVFGPALKEIIEILITMA